MLAETAAAAQQSASLAQGFFCAIAADLLHGPVPGGDSTAVVHGENTVRHGIYDATDKAVIQYGVIVGRHLDAFPENVPVTNGNVTKCYFLMVTSLPMGFNFYFFLFIQQDG
jgi:hypothetical protein